MHEQISMDDLRALYRKTGEPMVLEFAIDKLGRHDPLPPWLMSALMQFLERDYWDGAQSHTKQ